MTAHDDQQQLLRAYFERSIGSLRKRYKIALTTLNAVLIGLITWIVAKEVLRILVYVFYLHAMGIDPHLAFPLDTSRIELIEHIILVIIAIVGLALSFAMIITIPLPLEFRLVFTDNNIVRDYIKCIQVISGRFLFLYILSPQIVNLLMNSELTPSWLYPYNYTELLWLMLYTDFIAIELLMIDIVIAIAVCCKDKMIASLAWSAIAFAAYCGYWGVCILGSFTISYSSHSLESVYLVNYFVICGSALTVLLVVFGKSKIITHAKHCALIRLADEGCS